MLNLFPAKIVPYSISTFYIGGGGGGGGGEGLLVGVFFLCMKPLPCGPVRFF